MDLPLAESNALAKLVPEKPGISLKRVLHAPMQQSKDGEKSLLDKEGLGADAVRVGEFGVLGAALVRPSVFDQAVHDLLCVRFDLGHGPSPMRE